MKIRKTTLAAAFAATMFFVACDKDDKKPTTELSVHLTDNPYDATAVDVDIREVNVKVDGSDWISLPTHVGIYNLLDYQNGLDTLVCKGSIPAGRLQEVRFVLGSENSITIADTKYPLTIPSGSESGLKLKIDRDLRPVSDSIVVDFDAALSIFQEGTGDFKLKPVIKLK
ncbi:DUF4382 domain-containing protein [Flavihumibacter petaseus]|uniref:DUF4382 domain-containing protein n=1 Tax=Flavihumibacter petaseus NBRC 106054 TaxID=1220578 RepID=A0A0E9MTD9_9BACT|nr:DUF4382 domain-containing protein [Flavihumibacter petaseus]GAO41022.1 hypothetical protein FPE01S_01_00340 [Flavihumibacter petaseus NBRC 106054]